MRTGGPGHPMAPSAITYMSRILCEAKKWREAEQALRELLAVREQSQPDVWSTFYTKSPLGEGLMGQKKYVEAEPLILKGHEGLKAREKTIPPQASASIPEAIDRLIELYTLTMKPDETKKWKAKRAK